MKFYFPASLVPLADPLLSLIDTIYIGQYATTIELACLGPVTFILAFLSYVFYALAVSTNTYIAEYASQKQIEKGRQLLTCALLLSVLIGISLSFLLANGGHLLLRLIGISPELAHYSIIYLKIRALQFPTLLLSNVLIASLLGQKQSLIPALCIGLQLVLNLLLCVLFVQKWQQGIIGAAWSTIIAQIIGLVFLIIIIYIKATKDKDFIAPSRKLPKFEQMREIGISILPLAVGQASKSLYYFIVNAYAARMQQASMLAAHNAVWSFYTFCSFGIGPFDQVAITFVPLDEGFEKFWRVVKLIVYMSFVVGLMWALLFSTIVTFYPQMFSKDQSLYQLMQQVILPALLTLSITGADVACTGVILAQKQFGFLAKRYIFCLLVGVVYLAICNRFFGYAMLPVWWAQLQFFVIRLIMSGYSVLQLARREKEKGDDTSFIPQS